MSYETITVLEHINIRWNLNWPFYDTVSIDINNQATIQQSFWFIIVWFMNIFVNIVVSQTNMQIHAKLRTVKVSLRH